MAPSFFDLDMFGRSRRRADVAGMTSPVRCCRCSKVYDLGKVEVTARYTDCTVWKTPCCTSIADDRTWKSNVDFVRLDAQGYEVRS